jgi:uncharacterized protein YciI
MRAIRLLLVTALFTMAANAQVAHDPALAARLKADEYGMRVYVLALLKAGPNRNRPPEEQRTLQAAHRANIDRLAAAGKLVLAGPFEDAGELRGIYIFDVRTVAEAEALTKTDPAIQAGSLVMELHPWYGSAALMMVNEVHAKIQQPPALPK